MRQSLLAPAITGNAALLTDGIELLSRLSNDQYGHKRSEYSSAAIGEHIRHIADHYECFFSGIDDGHVNYDARNRHRLIEVDRDCAIDVLETLIQRLMNFESEWGTR